MSTEVLEQAVATTRGVLANVSPDQFDRPTPCASWDVRALDQPRRRRHALLRRGDDRRTVDRATTDYTAGDVLAAYDEGAAAAIAAFGAPGAMEQMVELPFAHPARRGVRRHRLDRPVHPRVGPRPGDGPEHRPRARLRAGSCSTTRGTCCPTTVRGAEGAALFGAKQDVRGRREQRRPAGRVPRPPRLSAVRPRRRRRRAHRRHGARRRSHARDRRARAARSASSRSSATASTRRSRRASTRSPASSSPGPSREGARSRWSHGGTAWRGWFPLHGELTSGTPDHKEGYYFGRELPPTDPRVRAGIPLHGPNVWPADAGRAPHRAARLPRRARGPRPAPHRGDLGRARLRAAHPRRPVVPRPGDPAAPVPLPAAGPVGAREGRRRAHRLRLPHPAVAGRLGRARGAQRRRRGWRSRRTGPRSCATSATCSTASPAAGTGRRRTACARRARATASRSRSSSTPTGTR